MATMKWTAISCYMTLTKGHMAIPLLRRGLTPGELTYQSPASCRAFSCTDLAKGMFDGAGVRQLNRLQASGLIDELLERHGGQRRNGNGLGSRGRFQREGRGAAR